MELHLSALNDPVSWQYGFSELVSVHSNEAEIKKTRSKSSLICSFLRFSASITNHHCGLGTDHAHYKIVEIEEKKSLSKFASLKKKRH